jgi:hypothetical protein
LFRSDKEIIPPNQSERREGERGRGNSEISRITWWMGEDDRERRRREEGVKGEGNKPLIFELLIVN